MTNDELWREFAKSGKISDYLRYTFGQENKNVDKYQRTCDSGTRCGRIG